MSAPSKLGVEVCKLQNPFILGSDLVAMKILGLCEKLVLLDIIFNWTNFIDVRQAFRHKIFFLESGKEADTA